MIKYITNWWRDYKAKGRLAEINRMRDTFRIKEKNGSLWLMHNDTAIDKIAPFASSEEIVTILNETRGFAIECEFGKEGAEPAISHRFARNIARELTKEQMECLSAIRNELYDL